MNMKKNSKIIIFIVIVIVLVGSYFILGYLKKDTISSDNKTTADIDTNINTDDGDEKVDWDSLEQSTVSSGEGKNITESGTYTLTGTINGTVVVNTTENVKLVLDNVTIKSNDGPAIMVEQAENVLIYLEEGTVNTLSDGTSYEVEDTEINSVIYSKDDLTFDGTGKLIVQANYQDGIVGKDDLKIINGTYDITSNDDGIRGKDSVYILDGDFTINSGGDGVKSTNDTDAEKGFILIENGTFAIDAELDGIQAETKLVIENGTYTIKTGGGSSNASTSNDWGNWGPWGGYNTSTDTESAKGLKAGDNLVIENGTLAFDTSDDAIHSNNYVGIKQGTISITSGDDGIHADTEIIIDNGTIDIAKSYEGIEAAKVTINGGIINLAATDDGINIAGGNDSSGMNRPGANNYASNTDNKLIINGGTIYVNATGDGIDINGSGYMYGGTVKVDGPTDSGNGTLDYDREFVVDGGTFIGAGSSGMLQNISSTKQYNVTIAFNSNYDAGTKVSIIDENAKEIITYSPSKKFSSIIISSSSLEKNKTYNIKVDGDDYSTFKTSSLSTSLGNRGGMPNGNMGGHRR